MAYIRKHPDPIEEVPVGLGLVAHEIQQRLQEHNWSFSGFRMLTIKPANQSPVLLDLTVQLTHKMCKCLRFILELGKRIFKI